ncbi:MAG: transporter [Sulfurovum sp. FS06-10]|jgi:outer membrane protein TolC|nr:MAG: transporter [Sulfurovum sp. FS06-10]
MILKKSLILVVVSLFSSTLLLQAEDGNNLTNLSLERALSIMEQNNLELKISKFNEQITAHEANIAKGNNYGKLDLKMQALRSNDAGNVFGFKLKSREASFGDFGFNEFDMSGQTNPLPVQPKDLNYPDTRNHFQNTLTYMVPLYTGGKLDQYGKITKALQTMSQLDTSKLLNEKIFQTTKTFYDISLIDQYIHNLSNIVNNVSKLENIVGNMKSEGFAKDIDELEVKSRKSEAESMLTQANYNKVLAYQYLSFLLNKNVTSIEPINTLAPIPHVEKEEIYQNNIDIQKAKLGLKITEMAIRLQEANFLPTIGAFGEYGSADNQAFNDFIDKDFYTVGVQLEWNLFNGAMDKENLNKAKIENMKVHEQIQLAKDGICLQTRKLLTEVKSKDAEITSLETQLDFATKVYENYQKRYQEGISSISDVLIKQSKELEVLLKLLTAKNDRNAKVFELTSIINEEGI